MGGSGPALDPGRPPRVGPYQVAAIIGASTWCTVYLAQDPNGRWVALKIPLFERLGDPRVLTRFRKEVEAGRALKHPNLAQVLDADPEDPFSPWMALEVCEGGSLGAWLDQNGPMPAYLAIEVMVRVVSALGAAHQQGVAQRRIGPDDVLLDRDGVCKLTDFRRVSGQALTSDSVDVRQDLQAAAGLLACLLTGTREGGQDLEGVPGVLADVIIKARAKGRGQGYPNASAMERDLEVAMLEVQLPAGQVPSLVGEDVALPADIEAVFDPDARFEELERMARWASDPGAGPAKVETSPESLYTQMAMGPSSSSPSRPSPPKRMARAHPVRRAGPAKPLAVDETPLAPLARSRAAAPFEQGVTPAPARRTAGQGFRPDYLADDQEVARDESWRQATPAPVKRVEAPKRERADPLVVLAIALLAVLIVFSVVGKGAMNVREARIAADEAGESLTAVVEAEGAVVNDLVELGADRKMLEDRFFAYKDARGAKRFAAAEAFAVALRQEAVRVGADPSAPQGSKGEVVERVKVVVDAHRRYEEERAQWGEVAQRFPGNIAVIMGFSRRP